MIEHFTAFALSYAASVACNHLPLKRKPKVQKQFEKAFKEAMEIWAPNDTVRKSQLIFVKGFIEDFKSQGFSIEVSIPKEFESFYKYFSIQICEHEVAYNFLKQTEDRKFQEEILKEIRALDNSERKNQTGLAARDKTSNKWHWYIYPNSEILLEDLFITPKFNLRKIAVDSVEEEEIRTTAFDKLFSQVEKSRVSIISGSYGCGKTILAKKIQKQFEENHTPTLFLLASELEKYVDSDLVRTELESFTKDIVVIIDALDELNFKNTASNGQNLSERVFNSFVSHLGKNIKLIVTTRIAQNEIDDALFNFAYFLEPVDIAEFLSLEVLPFGGNEIDKWLKSYFFIQEGKGENSFLTSKEIKGWRKNLKQACNNPLLLFQISERFVGGQLVDPDIYNVYSLYDEFIDNTINGRFYLESRNTKQLAAIKGRYREILKSIAIQIVELTDNMDELPIYEDFLDSNRSFNQISDQVLKDDLKDKIEKFATDKMVLQLNESELPKNVLNCYFFEHFDGKWRFRDNNILYHFVAERYFDSIYKYVKADGQTDLDAFYSSFEKSASIPLHILPIEFLLIRIRKEESVRKNLVRAIHDLIEGGFLLNITSSKQIKELDEDKLRVDILLNVIYLQLNQSGFGQIEYYFKRLNWYVSAVKKFEISLSHIVKRFFKDVTIRNAELRRMNLKGFNFDDSHLTNVRFIQDNLKTARFNGTKLEKVEFVLCDIEDSKMESVRGDIVFNNCILNDVQIEHPISLNVTFENCKIQRLRVAARNLAASPNCEFYFYNCDIRQLSLKKCRVESFVVNECIHNAFKFIGVDIRKYEVIKSIARSSKNYDADSQSRIRD